MSNDFALVTENQMVLAQGQESKKFAENLVELRRKNLEDYKPYSKTIDTTIDPTSASKNGPTNASRNGPTSGSRNGYWYD